MKKNIILMALAFAGLVACEQSVPYEPGAPMDVNGPNVYFSNTNSAAVILASDATEFEIAVIRDNAGSALSVPLEGLCTIEGLFDVPATVEFPSGVDSVNVKIGVSDKIEMFETYTLTLNVPEEYTHAYAQQNVVPSYTGKIIKEDYAPAIKGLFYDYFWEETAWDAVIEYSPILETYRLKNPWQNGGDDFTFTWDGAEAVKMGKSAYNTGLVHSSYGAITANVIASGTKYVHFGAGQLLADACDAFQFFFQWKVAAGSFGEYPEFFIVTERL
jgi:hypothetical protein